jgi:hypothetical protein
VHSAGRLAVQLGCSPGSPVRSQPSCWPSQRWAALGVAAPFSAALVIVPALAVTAFASLSPAGIGVTSGAVAIVLHPRGVDVTTALAAGIAVNAVETAAGLAAGIAGGLLLAFPTPAARRWTLLSVGACACLTATAVGVGSFADIA